MLRHNCSQEIWQPFDSTDVKPGAMCCEVIYLKVHYAWFLEKIKYRLIQKEYLSVITYGPPEVCGVVCVYKQLNLMPLSVIFHWYPFLQERTRCLKHMWNHANPTGSPMMSHGVPVCIKGCLHYTSSALLSSGSCFVCVCVWRRSVFSSRESWMYSLWCIPSGKLRSCLTLFLRD